VKPGELVSVTGPFTGVALVCEALSGVLRVGVVRTGAVLVGAEPVGAGSVALSAARLAPANPNAAAEAVNMNNNLVLGLFCMVKGGRVAIDR